MKTTVLCLLVLLSLAIPACSKGGYSDSSEPGGGAIALAPVVDASGVCQSALGCPGFTDCTPYRNPQGRPISVDPFWQERLDLCCAFRLCEVGGQCRYGCPAELAVPGC